MKARSYPTATVTQKRARMILTRDLEALARVLNRIEDPSARKIVIMSKWERRQITDAECEELIQLCDVVNA